jgi:hypothetical protein
MRGMPEEGAESPPILKNKNDPFYGDPSDGWDDNESDRQRASDAETGGKREKLQLTAEAQVFD